MTGGRIRVSITLGDMPRRDAFWADVPSCAAEINVFDLMDRMFPPSDADADAIRAGLDVRANPDLPEMYEVLWDLCRHWRAGTSQLTFRSSTGVVLAPSQPISCHVRAMPAQAQSSVVDQSLHLILEHRYEPLAAYEIDGGDRDGFAIWMRACILVYFLDKHRHVVLVDPRDDLYRGLLPIASNLENRGLIEPSPGGHLFEISAEGREFIGELMAEAEAYIGAFDAFSDVVPPQGLRPIEFATGRGLDLRTQVFRGEGIDAHRAVFLLRLYDGTLDAFKSDWRRRIHDDEFLNWVLEPALDHDRVEEEDLARVIEAARSDA